MGSGASPLEMAAKDKAVEKDRLNEDRRDGNSAAGSGLGSNESVD